MNIVHHRKVFYFISGLFVLAGILFLSFFGLRTGIDFTGGSLLEVEFSNERPGVPKIREALSGLDLGEIEVKPADQRGIILRLKTIDEEQHQKILQTLSIIDIEGRPAGQVIEKRFDSIGPMIGRELKRTASWAILLSLFAIILYIAFAFRKVSRPIASWKYGLCALTALFHDVFLTVALFALLGRLFKVEVDIYFIVALLTILGYSVNNTIVVFDRIRENLKKGAGADFSESLDFSIKQTAMRSTNASLTTLFVLAAIFFFGGATIKYFALALIFGIVVGTYSSVILAPSFLATWEGWILRKMK